MVSCDFAMPDCQWTVCLTCCLLPASSVQLIPSQPSTRTRPKLHFYHAKKDCMHNEELEGGSYVGILAGKVMPHRQGGLGWVGGAGWAGVGGAGWAGMGGWGRGGPGWAGMGGWGRVGWDGWVGQGGLGWVGGAGWAGMGGWGRMVWGQEGWGVSYCGKQQNTHRYLDLVQCAKCGCSDVVLIDIGLLML